MLKRAIKYGLLAVVLYQVGRIALTMGFHKTVYKHHPGPCRQIEPLAEGSEDMERIPGDKVLITTGMRFMHRHKKEYAGRVGRVYMFDLNTPDQSPAEVELRNYPGDRAEVDFHGLSVWVDPQTGEVRVFIVNHAADYDVVDIFTYNDDENTLYHQKTCGFGDPNIHVLNDVVAVGREEFYTTDYSYWRYTLAMVEGLLRLSWGRILYYNGDTSKVVQSGFLLPNGINQSPDGRYIYLSHIGAQSIEVYERNSDNSLTIKQKFPVYTFADNIDVDEDGDLWMGCHPIGYQIMQNMDEPSKPSTSQVLRLRTKDGLIADMTEVLLDDGKLISGSSVALYAKGRLLIGSVASQTAMCDVKYV